MFFPSLGNNDYQTDNAQPHLDYFTLPGNERYYEFQRGPIHWFILDTDPIVRGVEMTATQSAWLEQGLANSTAPWQIVVMHHPAYSSVAQGGYAQFRWPFAAWGADAVLAGDLHGYERLEQAGLAYFINGAGGAALYEPDVLPAARDAASGTGFYSEHGAMLIEASDAYLHFQFMTTAGQVLDTYLVSLPSVWLPVIQR